MAHTNQLVSVPPTIAQLQKLVHLDLANNMLKTWQVRRSAAALAGAVPSSSCCFCSFVFVAFVLKEEQQQRRQLLARV